MKKELATGHWRITYQKLLGMKVYKISAQNTKAISVRHAVILLLCNGWAPRKAIIYKKTLIKVDKSFSRCNLDPQKHFQYIMKWGPQSNWKQIIFIYLTWLTFPNLVWHASSLKLGVYWSNMLKEIKVLRGWCLSTNT